MTPTPIVGSNIEKINPMKVLTYNELHEDDMKSHGRAYHKLSSVHTESMKKVVSGVVERVEKETKKMVRK
jgi:hypothetical protein